jgi:serine/threonine-protein kinase HipA
MLGLTVGTASRELDRMVQRIAVEADAPISEIITENEKLLAEAQPNLGNEVRVLRAIRHIIIQDVVKQLAP